MFKRVLCLLLGVLPLLCHFVYSDSPTAGREGGISNIQEITIMTTGWSSSIMGYQQALIDRLISESPLAGTKINWVNRSLDARKTPVPSKPKISFSSVVPSGRNSQLHASSFPYLKNLLGIRRCLIRQESIEIFNALKTIDDFRSVKIGQGMEWPDSLVYKSYGITVVGSFNIQYLPPMLEQNRFDCLSLSTIEVEEFVSEEKKLLVAEDMFIIYPLSMKLLSGNTGLLRILEEAFNREYKNGNIDKLLVKSFGSSAAPSLKDARVFFLNNPQLSDDKNIAEINKIKQLYSLD